MSSEVTAKEVTLSRRTTVILTLATLLVTLTVGELSARLFLPAPFRIRSRKPSSMKAMPRFVADPEIGWVNAPEDATYHFVSAGPGGTTDAVYHMHDGLRVSSSAPVGGPIVIIAGCSFTYGMGVNDADTWPWMMQEQIPDYHIINAGTSAYGIGQALLRADQMIARYPNQVKSILFAFGDFQVDRDRARQRDLVSLYPFGRPRYLIDGTGVKKDRIVYFWSPGPLLERSSLVMSVVNHAAEIANKTPSQEGAEEIAVRLFGDFYKRSQARGISFGVIVLPWGSDDRPPSVKTRNTVVSGLRNLHIPVFAPAFPRGIDGRIDKNKYFIASDEFHPNRAYNLIFSKSASSSARSLLDGSAAH